MIILIINIPLYVYVKIPETILLIQIIHIFSFVSIPAPVPPPPLLFDDYNNHVIIVEMCNVSINGK